MTRINMKALGSAVLAAALALSLAACSPAGPEPDSPADNPANETVSEPVSGSANDTGSETVNEDASGNDSEAEILDSETSPSEGGRVLENGGLKLPIPAEYEDLLVFDLPQNSEWEVLFYVAEKASVEAEKALNGEDGEMNGAGELFGISRISEAEAHELFCYDMSGLEPFAVDAEGQYYVFAHPTDVRIVRESYENMEDELVRWGELNQWAATVPETILAENPALTPVKRSKTTLDMFLARIAWLGETNYTLSTTEYGPLEPGAVDPTPWVSRLMDGVTFEDASEETAPAGEYVVLNFPEEETRFDFFHADKNLIRMVWGSDNELLLRANFDDDTKAMDVMQEWYHALAEAR